MAVNGTNTSSPSSLSRHDSEESFVVLSRSPGAEPQSLTSLNSTLPSMSNVASIPNTFSKDDVLPERSITASVVSDLSPEEIQAKMESILQENMELKEALTQNNIAMKKQFNTLVMWQEDVMKVHKSHKEKFEETKKLISSLRAENMELKKSASLPNSFISGEDINALKSKISTLEFELQTLREANIKYKMDHSKQVDEIKAILESTEKEARETIKKLNAEKVDLNNKLKATEEKLRVALVKIEEMKSHIPSETELRNVDYLKAQIKELSEEVILKAKVLQEKTELTDKLHEEISKLKIENEVIPILREQVEVYQTDFKQERLARTTLKEEKDRLALDLHHLQQRNEQLLQQIESSSFVHVSASTSRHSPTERQMSPPLASYDCPICQNRFRSMKILDEHIDSCLQNSN